jgi:hypothetical protein
MYQRVRTLALPIAFAALSVSCSDSTAPTNDIRRFITDVATTTGASASFHAGSVPTGGSGPVVNVSGSSAMIRGGGALRTVTSAQAFTRVIVAISGIDGYWEVNVPSTTTQDVTLTLAQELPQQSFTVQYAAGTSAAVGAFDDEAVSVIQVGTGDIQVSVSWDAPSDVDLHVVDPSNEEVFYGNTTVASGGVLDLDSNPACSIDGKNNENITWPSTTPPHGTYTVRLDYYAGCGVAATKYLVTVQVKGQTTRTFSGTFTGDGDGGAEGSGIDITTFTY